jgi:hypothetical protein
MMCSIVRCVCVCVCVCWLGLQGKGAVCRTSGLSSPRFPMRSRSRRRDIISWLIWSLRLPLERKRSTIFRPWWKYQRKKESPKKQRRETSIALAKVNRNTTMGADMHPP